ncbi:hypothetical protein NIES2107_35100 [Nostoc carneum NIES-2107]|nr:hypothetical protein NIES2107_35100 [Nostoc carneum NIES-2107]
MKETSSQESLFLNTDYNQQQNRIFSIDLMKAISIVAVVSFHSIFIPRAIYADISLAISLIFSPLRFCVPLFLTISFLLLEKGVLKEHTRLSLIKKRLQRILIPTIFWFGLVAILKTFTKTPGFEITVSLLNGEIFTGGYYLLILLQFFTIFLVARVWFNKPYKLTIALVLQVCVYLWIHLIHLRRDNISVLSILHNLNRPLFIYWFVYIALGIYFCHNWQSIVKKSVNLSFKYKTIIILIYTMSQYFESYIQLIVLRENIPPFDYTMISCIFSVFAFIICLASIQEHQLHPIYRKWISILSTYSLGIFCINGILYQVFLSISTYLLRTTSWQLNIVEIIVVKLIGLFLLLGMSLSLSILLDKIGLKALVR